MFARTITCGASEYDDVFPMTRVYALTLLSPGSVCLHTVREHCFPNLAHDGARILYTLEASVYILEGVPWKEAWGRSVVAHRRRHNSYVPIISCLSLIHI